MKAFVLFAIVAAVRIFLYFRGIYLTIFFLNFSNLNSAVCFSRTGFRGERPSGVPTAAIWQWRRYSGLGEEVRDRRQRPLWSKITGLRWHVRSPFLVQNLLFLVQDLLLRSKIFFFGPRSPFFGPSVIACMIYCIVPRSPVTLAPPS